MPKYNLDFFDSSDPPIELTSKDDFYKLFLQQFKKARSGDITYGLLYLSSGKKTFVKFLIHNWVEKQIKAHDLPVKRQGNSRKMEG